MKPFDLFVACLPGLEPWLGAEMRACGFRVVEGQGGVSLQGHRNAVYRANLELGLATHVLIRVGEFRVRSFQELIRKTAALPWEGVLRPDLPFDVRATCRQSRLYHSAGVEERVALGILERLGSSPNPNAKPPCGMLPCVRARLVDDVCTLSFDTSGEPLHRRGYKLDVGPAPLREDIARALLLASGYDPQAALIDPLAGHGTIAIEAALLGRQIAPGLRRRFVFEDSAVFDPAAFAEAKANATAAALPRCPAAVHACDRDAGAIAALRANAERAGIVGDLKIRQCAISAAPYLCGDAPGAGLVATNPPWGKRLGNTDALRPLYQTLGKLARGLPDGWHVGLIAMSRRLALSSGLRLKTAFSTEHGGQKIRALVAGG